MSRGPIEATRGTLRNSRKSAPPSFPRKRESTRYRRPPGPEQTGTIAPAPEGGFSPPCIPPHAGGNREERGERREGRAESREERGERGEDRACVAARAREEVPGSAFMLARLDSRLRGNDEDVCAPRKAGVRHARHCRPRCSPQPAGGVEGGLRRRTARRRTLLAHGRRIRIPACAEMTTGNARLRANAQCTRRRFRCAASPAAQGPSSPPAIGACRAK